MSSAPASPTSVTRAASARPTARGAGRYALPGGFLACFITGQGAYLCLSPAARASFLAFASTNLANLSHDPVGCLAVSAFVTGGSAASALTWLPMIAVALHGAARAAGPWRAAGVGVAGHVIGTLVSEGLVARQISSGALPASSRTLTDVGPSYVVVSALVLAMLCLPWSPRNRAAWIWRILAAVVMLLLVFPGQIFSGLSALDVAAVGHATATVTAGLAALSFFLLRLRRRQPETVPPTASPIR